MKTAPCILCGVEDTLYSCHEAGEPVNLCDGCWAEWHAGSEPRFELLRALNALRK